MNLFATGNLGVGVGGTDSGYKLDVNGTTRFSGTSIVTSTGGYGAGLVIQNTTATANNFSVLTIQANTDGYPIIEFKEGSDQKWQIYNNYVNDSLNFYKMGVGAGDVLSLATSGAATFSGKTNVVKDISDYAFTVTNTNTSGYGMYLQAGGTNNAIDVYNASGATQIFKLTGTGAATFSSTIQTNGNAYILPTITGGGSGGIFLGVYPDTQYTKQAILAERYTSTSGNYGRGNLHFCNRDTADANQPTLADSRMVITSGGNVLIGTTTDAGYKLNVNGIGSFAGSGTVTGKVYIQAGHQWFIKC